MKILHTSDWHVGKMLRGRSRAEEHEAVLAEIASIATAEQVDLVLVTGDLFDTAAPTAEAERIVYRALLDLQATGATVIVLSGNHDNDRRLQAVEPLLGLGNVITRANVVRAEQGGVVEVRSGSGERAKVILLPFLSQRYVIRADQLMRGDAADHDQAYSGRIQALIELLAQGFESDTINLVAAHLFADAGVLGGGERMAQTVMDYAVPSSVFPASAHYVALGHLHRAQRIPGACPIWYAGSPLALDFGEVADEKGVLLVEAAVDRPAKVEKRTLGHGRRLRTISGTIAELARLASTTGDDYLKVVVREAARAGLAEEVRGLFADAVDVVIDAPTDDDGTGGEERRHVGARSGLTPQQLFDLYLEDQKIDDPRIATLFAELLDEQLAPGWDGAYAT